MTIILGNGGLGLGNKRSSVIWIKEIERLSHISKNGKTVSCISCSICIPWSRCLKESKHTSMDTNESDITED